MVRFVCLVCLAACSWGSEPSTREPVRMTLIVASDLVDDEPDAVVVSVRTEDEKGSEVHLVGWELGACAGDPTSEVRCDNGVHYVVRGMDDALVVERIPGGQAPPKIMLRKELSGS